MEITRDLTGPERLNLLLPWINGDRLRPSQIRELLFDFLEPSAGVEAKGLRERGFTRTAPDFNHELFGKRAMTARALERLRLKVRMVLEQPGEWLRFAPLHFTAIRHGEHRVVVVAGHIPDVVLYQVMRMLTLESMVVVAHCLAPAPGDRTRRCARWFITNSKGRGRPKKFCSNSCRQRNFQEKDANDYRNARRKKGG